MSKQNSRTDVCEKRAIDEIGKRYVRLDGEYAKVMSFPANVSISPNGLSLLDDLEFFLSQPGFNTELEEGLFEIVQVYALKFLRSRKELSGGVNEQISS